MNRSKVGFKTYLVIGIIWFIIIFRLFFIYFLLNYVRYELNTIPGYKGKLLDLDVQLISGSYTLKKLELWKSNASLPIPFFSAEKIDIALEWNAIFHGKLVGKIIFYSPAINFVLDPQGANEQLTINEQWLTVVKSLFPLNLNKIEINNGRLSFRSFNAKPPFDLELLNIEMKIQNMRNVVKNDSLLPSFFNMTGQTSDGGKIRCRGRFNPFVNSPTFTLELSLNKLNVKSIANFLKHFTKVDAENGKFDLFVELAAAKGKIKGYAKPFISGLKIGKPKNNNVFEALLDKSAMLIAKIIENPQHKTIATKVQIRGDLNDPDTSMLSIIGYILRHAFIEALIPQIDHSIKMKSLINFSDKDLSKPKNKVNKRFDRQI